MDLFFLLAAEIQSRGDRTRMGTFGDQEMVSHHGEGQRSLLSTRGSFV